jgi:hypothetical protein
LGGERGDLEASDWFSIVKYKKWKMREERRDLGLGEVD